jgi:hypothetical protein
MVGVGRHMAIVRGSDASGGGGGAVANVGWRLAFVVGDGVHMALTRGAA